LILNQQQFVVIFSTFVRTRRLTTPTAIGGCIDAWPNWVSFSIIELRFCAQNNLLFLI
jgi:hypothetical protein